MALAPSSGFMPWHWRVANRLRIFPLHRVLEIRQSYDF